MDQSKKKKYFFIVGPLVIFIALIGLTYAFFNYTRTGQANTLGTGRIYFNTTQGEALTLTNIFPMTATEAGNANLDSVTVGITGDTTYLNGEEFEITLADVNNTVNGKKIPLNYIATYTAATGGTIGASSNDYWNARNSKDTTIYQLNANGSVEENVKVLVGYIDNGATGISGTLTISAYIDADRIAISDTYYGNVTATPTPTAPNDQYGTTTEWVNGRTVLTTSEWNSLSSNPISFKIKAESNEGIWVRDPDSIIESCPGCKYIYTTNEYYYSANNSNSSPLSTLTTFANNNETLTDDYRTLNKNYFLGFKFDGSGNVTNAYACGIKGEDPNNGKAFCIEGALSDTYGGNSTTRTAIYNANYSLLNTLYGPYDSGTGFGCDDYGSYVLCGGSVGANANSDGHVTSDGDDWFCLVRREGDAHCLGY